MADAIRLIGMQFYAYHGADPEERRLGQRFEVDVTLHADLSRAAATDDVADAINYREVYETVAACMDPPCNLLEAVAGRIAERVLAEHTGVAAIAVTVRKPSVPMGGLLRWAEVEVERG